MLTHGSITEEELMGRKHREAHVCLRCGTALWSGRSSEPHDCTSEMDLFTKKVDVAFSCGIAVGLAGISLLFGLAILSINH